MIRPRLAVVCLFMALLAASAHRAAAEPPKGFVSLFNGKDFAGWRGRPHFSPYEEAKFTPELRAAKQAEWNADRDKHWKVDAEKGLIVNDGHGVFLSTEKDYGDVEFYVDWLMVSPRGDSGIYLRGIPQIQIWDPQNPNEVKNGVQKGSGALWNNNNDNPGKWPLVKADNPIGQWNTFRVKMIGSRVWISFNGKLTVDGQILDNFFDRKIPALQRGPIQLQTHGSEMHFRNIFLREIPAEEANATLAKRLGSEGFKSVFNGKDFDGWAGPVNNYEIVDGAIVCLKGKGGTIHTKEEFADFVVRFEFKLPPNGNNGLAIRYPGSGDCAYVGMCELQVLADDYKGIDPRQAHGSAYGMAAAVRGFQRPIGQWNYQEVTVKGSTIKVELNGNVILDTDLSKITEYMAKSPHPGKDRKAGHFGFAGHNDPVAYRNIQIMPLK